MLSRARPTLSVKRTLPAGKAMRTNAYGFQLQLTLLYCSCKICKIEMSFERFPAHLARARTTDGDHCRTEHQIRLLDYVTTMENNHFFGNEFFYKYVRMGNIYSLRWWGLTQPPSHKDLTIVHSVESFLNVAGMTDKAGCELHVQKRTMLHSIDVFVFLAS